MTTMNVLQFLMAGSLELMLLEQYFCPGLNLKKKDWMVIFPLLCLGSIIYGVLDIKFKTATMYCNLAYFTAVMLFILSKYGIRSWGKCFYILEASAFYAVLNISAWMAGMIFTARSMDEISDFAQGLKGDSVILLMVMLGLAIGVTMGYVKFKKNPHLTAQFHPIDFIVFQIVAESAFYVRFFIDKMRIQYGRDVYYSFWFLAVCIAFCILSLMCIGNKRKQQYYKEQAAINRVYLNQQLEYFKEYKKDQETLRRFRHDVNNHFTCIRQLYHDGSTEELNAYLKNISDYIEDSARAYCTGNDVADAVINSKGHLMQQEYITFQCEGQFRTERLPEPMDLCAILANALDNAIEESRNIQYPKERLIALEIKNTSNFMLLIIRNHYLERPDIRHNRFNTSKSDRQCHGYGLENIRLIVERYGGSMSIHADDEYFTLEIIL